jgi:hypothetical protein
VGNYLTRCLGSYLTRRASKWGIPRPPTLCLARNSAKFQRVIGRYRAHGSAHAVTGPIMKTLRIHPWSAQGSNSPGPWGHLSRSLDIRRGWATLFS